MAKCIYCNQWTGVFGREHAECRAKHERAVSLIPGFFSKLMESSVPAEKFVELLQGVANTSFIERNQLRDLSRESMVTAINSVLAERSASVAEARRLADIADALEKAFPEGLELDQTLIKVLMLAELDDRVVPDYVSITGQIPVEFGPGETGLWIFNQVEAWWKIEPDGSGAMGFDQPDLPTAFYVRQRQELAQLQRPEAKPQRGDLLITNRKLYFIRNEIKHVGVPIPRIFSLTPYGNGVSITYDRKKPRAALFRLDDGWFASNLIGRLILRMPRVAGHAQENADSPPS